MSPPESTPSAGVPQRLSERLLALARFPTGETTTLGHLLAALDERSHALLLLFLVVPFLQPIPLPVVSTAFGLAVAALGFQMARNRPPWLPRRLARKPLSAQLVQKMAQTGAKLFRRFERVVRPRGRFLHAHPGARRLVGVLIAIAGLLLSLPLPIPVSNFLPAFTVTLLALGSLEEDGLVVALGYVAFVLTSAFFVALGLLPLLGVESLRELLSTR